VLEEKKQADLKAKIAEAKKVLEDRGRAVEDRRLKFTTKRSNKSKENKLPINNKLI
jgi:hypothetical protein